MINNNSLSSHLTNSHIFIFLTNKMSKALDEAYSEAQELLKKTNKQIEENEKHIKNTEKYLVK